MVAERRGQGPGSTQVPGRTDRNGFVDPRRGRLVTFDAGARQAVRPPPETTRRLRRSTEQGLPESQVDRQAYAELIGADGRALLTAITAPTAPSWLREVPADDVVR